LEILEKAGFIEVHGQTVSGSHQLEDPGLQTWMAESSLEREMRRLAAEDPVIAPHINLLWACLIAYPDVLTGRRNHMDVMFPGGSRSLVEGIYKGNPSIDYYNRLMTRLAKTYIGQRLGAGGDQTVRILEIGAGTGGTSAFVLKEIDSYRKNIQYYYTDISAGFTRYGSETYGPDYSFARFKVLDIEKSPQAQGFEPGTIDLVLASNVLHATRDMTGTLGRVKTLMKTNGVLVVNEITQLWDFATLTFGLTDGWWFYQDEENRIKNSPLLEIGKWRELLTLNGFREVSVRGIPGVPAEEFEQCVIAAESDGQVNVEAPAGTGKKSAVETHSFSAAPRASRYPRQQTVPADDPGKQAEEYVKGVLAAVLKIDRDAIDHRATFENYGVDSLVTLDINKEFSRDFEKLPTTLLFEYTTVEALAGYFIDNHRSTLEGVCGLAKAKITEAAPVAPPTPVEIFQEEICRDDAADTRDIAIVGLSGRYPMAATLEDYWDNLQNGRHCISEAPPGRWDWKTLGPGFAHTRWGGFIENVDSFDSLFFNISPAEAQGMDPQERLFLEAAWQTLEDAGITRADLAGPDRGVGVFVGVMNRDYEWIGLEAPGPGRRGRLDAHCPYSSIANRVSYFLDLHGPSLAVDTSCSSSLTALHLACQGIRRGECTAAIAGGVNLILHPAHYSVLSEKNMLSHDGKCRSFGSGGDGFAVGEGVGAVLLKPLEDALRDGNRVYGVIKGTAVNSGGKTGGYMVPNPNAQANVVADALEAAQIDPRTISYLEAQASGSALGDPIEIAGLIKTFRQYTGEKQFCAIGSVKSNIGHLESASGIAALTKVLLQMKYKRLVPSLHAQALNPDIDFAGSPFYVQRRLSEWKQPVINENGAARTYPRRAGVSSFGAGGANAHVVLEEPPGDSAPVEPWTLTGSRAAGAPREPRLIVLSARNKDRLLAYARRMVDFLETLTAGRNDRRDAVLTQKLQEDLLKLAAAVLNVPVKDIDADEHMIEYGFDAPLLAELSNRIAEIHGTGVSMTPAVFSEAVSLRMLARYLLEHHGARLAEYYPGRDSGPGDRGPGETVSLDDIAYTLQVGREAMDERLALAVRDLPELKEKLNRFCLGGEQVENLFHDNIKKHRRAPGPLPQGKAAGETIGDLIDNRDVVQLARCWVTGMEVDWKRLYAGGFQEPRRVSLPAYPFARQRCWLEPREHEAAAGDALSLHPLIGANTSTLERQRFTTRLTGAEFFSRDHIVAGQTLLPGVVYLEMARAAGEIAGEAAVGKIRKIAWVSPIMLSRGALDVAVSLYPRGNEVEYRIATGTGEQQVVHGSGALVFQAPGTNIPAGETIDVEAVKTRCPAPMAGETCYGYFREAGLDYGPCFRAIRQLYANDSETLALLELPRECRDGASEFKLHPSLMDGALQSVMGLIGLEGKGVDDLSIPFALEELEILGNTGERCYAYARPADDNAGPFAGGDVRKFNVYLLDESGQAQVRMRNFSVRALRRQSAQPVQAHSSHLLYCRDVWEKASPSAGSVPPTLDHVILFVHSESIDIRRVIDGRAAEVTLVIPGQTYREPGEGVYIINPAQPEDYRRLMVSLRERRLMPGKILHTWLWTDETDRQSHLESDEMNRWLLRGVYSLFHLTRVIMAGGPAGPVDLLAVYSSGDNQGHRLSSLSGALSGFCRSVRRENPRFDYRTVEIRPAPGSGPARAGERDLLLERLVEELAGSPGRPVEIRYDHDGSSRYARRLEELPAGGGTGDPARLKEKGVYLVTGAAGALGLVFAGYLAREMKARLVLTDIAPPGPGKQEKIGELESAGAEVLFIQADISERREVEKLVAEARARFKQINGVIHCAGTLRDGLLLNKSAADMAAVLAPKIYGSCWLDEVLKDEPLDVFVMFSSAAALTGSAGQCDYAYANRFMDCFAVNRERLRSRGERQGKTIAINWPLWKQGGMTVNEHIQARLETDLGLTTLDTADGWRAFQEISRSGEARAAVLPGDRPGLLEKLDIIPAKTSHKEPSPPPRQQAVEQDLLNLCAELLKVKPGEIDPDDELGDYGLDSIMMMTMLNRLEAMYGVVLEPNALAVHRSIRKLAGYLTGRGGARRVDENAAADRAANVTGESRPRFRPAATASSGKIAIIGMACRFPQSHNPARFWDNLAAGRNLVKEIPADRWKLSEYYSPDKNARNKTYCKWGGFIDNVYDFDPGYFGIKEEDALVMDPQHRLVLELGEELFRRSGYRREELDNSRTGVYIGGGESFYLGKDPRGIPDVYLKRVLVNTIQNMMAARVSDFYNLRGPSYIVDTACSSALVAIHQACRDIRNRECDMAAAGGVELLISPYYHIAFSKAGILSDDGVSYVFDERAKGFVPGEGVGLVLLKAYEDALRDGDDILAVILGSAVNNDGHTMGLTVPNQEGQKEVIQRALEDSGISPDSITYLEAHGTGTLLGDPIEIRAATRVYRQYTRDKQYCAVGSVKSNTGHLGRAAGVPGLLKTVLALRHTIIPPTLHCDVPHPRFKFEESPFYPITAAKRWLTRKDYHARRAALSAFGFGGTNCHMILEEFNPPPSYVKKRNPLPPPRFSKKFYRLGHEIAAASGLKTDDGYGDLLGLLEDLHKGKIDSGKAFASMDIRDEGIIVGVN
jgi:acyl transferase domain-containing protein/acyl carrier protein